MANVLNANPIVIDTVAADVVITTAPLKMFLMEFVANGAPGRVVLIDGLGNLKAILDVPAATGGVDRQEWHFPVYVNDLIVDQSASTFPAGSTLLIYV